MEGGSSRRQDLELRRVDHCKRGGHRPAALPLGEQVIAFFKHSVQRRQTRLERIARSWEQLVPAMLNEHCCLESLHRGTLTVLVDSSSHLYEMKHLLLAGLQKQIMLSCASAGLRKIVLKPGRWYDGDGGERKVRF